MLPYEQSLFTCSTFDLIHALCCTCATVGPCLIQTRAFSVLLLVVQRKSGNFMTSKHFHQFFGLFFFFRVPTLFSFAFVCQ